MDVFGLHRRLIDDYSRFTRSFVDVADPQISAEVEQAIAEGYLWPDAWVQLNPSYEPAGTPDQLVNEGLLHSECAKIFRAKDDLADFDQQITLHRHQTEAIAVAGAGWTNQLRTNPSVSGEIR
jgi:hypothetical protein